MRDLKREDKKVKQTYVDPDELRRRLDQLVRSIRGGEVRVKLAVEVQNLTFSRQRLPKLGLTVQLWFQNELNRTHKGDKLSQALQPVQEELKREFDKRTKEVDRARAAQAKVARFIQRLFSLFPLVWLFFFRVLCFLSARMLI